MNTSGKFDAEGVVILGNMYFSFFDSPRVFLVAALVCNSESLKQDTNKYQKFIYARRMY